MNDFTKWNPSLTPLNCFLLMLNVGWTVGSCSFVFNSFYYTLYFFSGIIPVLKLKSVCVFIAWYDFEWKGSFFLSQFVAHWREIYSLRSEATLYILFRLNHLTLCPDLMQQHSFNVYEQKKILFYYLWSRLNEIHFSLPFSSIYSGKKYILCQKNNRYFSSHHSCETCTAKNISRKMQEFIFI